VYRTTAPPACDVAALFGGIEQYAVTATRLHPRRGVPDPLGSHIGGPLRQLLQIDSGEWGDPRRWLPVQEQALTSDTADYLAATEPTGIIAGRSGLYRVFHCPLCPDPQPRIDVQ
jgi:hypothetical protein